MPRTTLESAGFYEVGARTMPVDGGIEGHAIRDFDFDPVVLIDFQSRTGGLSIDKDHVSLISIR